MLYIIFSKTIRVLHTPCFVVLNSTGMVGMLELTTYP